MKADQYIAVRSEDLVLGNYACYKRLAAFLKLPESLISEMVNASITLNLGHEQSYMGNKYNDTTRDNLYESLKTNNRVEERFALWGYEKNSFRLTLDCESLPWMDQVRERKGPLPGDS
jgi:hypothetical protein